ncbi:MAG TPA: uroporphyrinogen-III synthase [Sphingomicrobium sp.]|nr:uroporphyrinogen-III synthase [Sphingomicrobium sp.]
MRPLVILRPEPGASATATAAAKLGLKPIVVPLFEVRPVEWRLPETAEFEAILFTSANAIRHGGPKLKRLRDLPAHCVGKATASAAQDAGFEVASVGRHGVDALLDSLSGKLRLLHPCGSEHREPRDSRQSITAVPVYRASAIEDPEGLDAMDGSVVAVHSPRAASRLCELAVEKDLSRETIGIAAISKEAASAAGSGWENVEDAAEPSDTALLALASRLCNNR